MTYDKDTCNAMNVWPPHPFIAVFLTSILFYKLVSIALSLGFFRLDSIHSSISPSIQPMALTESLIGRGKVASYRESFGSCFR